jgi:ankyrin repeat protein
MIPHSANGTGDIDGMLILAIQQGDLDVVRALLDAGAPPDGDPSPEHEPIGEAAWRGHAEIVRELAARGGEARVRRRRQRDRRRPARLAALPSASGRRSCWPSSGSSPPPSG